MRASIAIFAAGVAAHSFTPVQREVSLVQRDVPTITSQIALVQAATQELDTAINAYSGAADSESLLAASENVVSTIQAGTAAIEPTGQLTVPEAFSLVGPVGDLGAVVRTTVDDAIAKKQAFVDACQGPTVLDQLNQQKTAAVAFAAVITSKVPEDAKPIADEQSAPIIQALDDGIAAFADQTSLPPSCGSSSAPTVGPTSVPTAVPTSAGTSGVPSLTISLPTGVPTASTIKPTGGLPTGLPETCIPGTTHTVTVTVPPSKPTGTGVTTHVVPSSTKTWTHGTPTPSPPSFTGAAVVNGANFGAAAMAALALVAAL